MNVGEDLNSSRLTLLNVSRVLHSRHVCVCLRVCVRVCVYVELLFVFEKRKGNPRVKEFPSVNVALTEARSHAHIHDACKWSDNGLSERTNMKSEAKFGTLLETHFFSHTFKF
jgi:hypothetical protein